MATQLIYPIYPTQTPKTKPVDSQVHIQDMEVLSVIVEFQKRGSSWQGRLRKGILKIAKKMKVLHPFTNNFRMTLS
jgi:hypothetical protein